MSTVATSAGVRALEALLELLAGAGIEASRAGGDFYAQPAGVIVGLPTLARRLVAGHTFTIPVYAVSSDPLNTELAVDRLYALADELAYALKTDNYRPSEWRASPRAEPLPALELTVTVTVTEGGT